MVLESTVLCVDNSEFMRNGDFTPTRMQAQQEAAQLIMQCKLRSNPENVVGVITMADKAIQACLTQDNSKLFMKLHQTKVCGEANVLNSVRTARLVLNHRQNRNHRSRMVVFIGSPLGAVNAADLKQLAKQLKKENFAVDVICFGVAGEDNVDKMTAFVDTLNGRDGTSSHLVVVPAGSKLSEAVAASPICRGEGGEVPAVMPAGAGGFDLDGADDPELAMALRVSLEEQRQRQELEARSDAPAVAAQPMETATAGSAAPVDMDAMTEEQQLAYALRMSLAADASTAAEPMETSGGGGGGGGEFGDLINDPAALEELIATLPGVSADSQMMRDVQQSARPSDADKKAATKEKKPDDASKPDSEEK